MQRLKNDLKINQMHRNINHFQYNLNLIVLKINLCYNCKDNVGFLDLKYSESFESIIKNLKI